MKKILLIFFVLVASLSFSQDNGYYGSYTYTTQAYDTLTFRQTSDIFPNVTVQFNNDLAGDSILVKQAIGSDFYIKNNNSNISVTPQNNVLKLIFPHNFLTFLFLQGMIDLIDISQQKRLTDFRIQSGVVLSSTLATNPSLTYLYLNGLRNTTEQQPVSISNNERLTDLTLNGVLIESVDISNNKILQNINLNATSSPRLSSITLGNPNPSVITFTAQDQNLNQSNIDNILKWLVDAGRYSQNGDCLVLLDGGNNSCPSSTGISNAQTLVARGWWVKYNPCGGTNNPPIVATVMPSYISMYSAQSGGNITSQGSASVSVRGVCWNTTGNPTTANSKTTDGSGEGAYVSHITGLSAGTTYYVRAYATNTYGTSYGNEYTFTTLSDFSAPTITTNMISEISNNSAVSGGHFISDGGLEILEKGVCWNTTGSPNYNSSKTNDGSGATDYISSITGLSSTTTYYVRAYARGRILVGGFYVYVTGYGQEETFTTTGSGTLPTVSTYTANTITSSSAYSGGNVTSDGGSSITLRGVCYSTSPNPTISNSKTTDGSGTGSFISYLSGLECGTTYYVRAYATNQYGTGYGDQVSFIPNNYPLIIANLSGYAANQSGCVSIGGYWSVTLSSPATSNLIVPITITNGTNNGYVNYNIPISYGNTTGSISINYYLQSSPWIANGSIQSIPCGYSIGTSANINIPVCSPTLNIGDSYGGGIIAYIFKSGDPGYIPGEVHGIICANSDETFGRNWSDFQHIISTNTGLGDGTQNTNNIVSYFGNGTYAARLCYDSTRGGYSDWILPSKDELNKLYQLRLLGYGGFDITNSYTSLYWTSSQSDSANAWVQSFYDGTQGIRNIISGVSTRAIRYF